MWKPFRATDVRGRRRPLAGAVAVGVLLASAGAQGQDPAPPVTETPPAPRLHDDHEPGKQAQIPAFLEVMFDGSSPHVFDRTLEGQLPLIEEGHGLLLQLGVTLVGQYATESLTDRYGLANVTYDLAGAVRLFESEVLGQGVVSWWVRGGRPIGAPTDSDLNTDIGSDFPVNATLIDDAVLVQELYWAQYIGGEELMISAGRIDPTFRYDFNNVANSERDQFLNLALVNSSAIPFPDPGLGIDFRWQPGDLIYVRGGVHQANSRANSASLNELRADELLWAGEFGLMPSFDGWGEGNYRFLAYFIETDGETGPGFSLSFDQEIGPVTPFLRFSVGDADVTDYEYFVSAGFGIEDPLGRQGDLLAAGWAWGDPTDDELRSEQIIELFYRFQLNPFLTLTPDVQFVINPAANREDDFIAVFSVRLQATF